MGIFSGKKQREELVLVFDIGSSSVGAAFFYSTSSGIPKIVFSVRQPLPLESRVDFERFFATTARALDIVSDAAFKASVGKPEKIFCVLSSSWYVSQTRVATMEKINPFVFTSKLADDLLKKELYLFQESYMKGHGGERQFREIEIKSIKTTLNGYEVTNPINQKAKEVQMNIFVSMSEERVLQAFEASIGRHFPHHAIKFTSFVMASFVAVRDMFVHQDNFLLIDIGGEVTDITMVKNNILRESLSYPMGRNFILRGIAQHLSTSIEEATTMFSLYKDGHGAKEVITKIEPAIKRVKGEWLSSFQASLANLSSDISIPSAIFMASESLFAEFFSDVIRNEQFNQYTLTQSKFQIIPLSAETLHGAASFEESVTRDSFLILESIYINRILNKI